MGRKAKALKPEAIQPTSEIISLPEVQIAAAGDTFLCDTSGFTKKKLKTPTARIRRSPRIQSIDKEVEPVNRELEPVIEEILISENQNDGEPIMHEDNKVTGKASDESGCSSKKDEPGAAGVNYKSMYISSQKKIEALIEVNKLLGESLELANGKIEVFEKQSNLYSEVLAVMASLSRVNESLAARVMLGSPHDDNEECDGRLFKKRRNE